MRIGKSLALGAAGLTSFLVLWEGIVQARFVSQAFLPAPSQIPAALLRGNPLGLLDFVHLREPRALSRGPRGRLDPRHRAWRRHRLSHPSEAFLAWVVRLLRPIRTGLGALRNHLVRRVQLRRRCSSSPSGVFWILLLRHARRRRAVDRDLLEVADAYWLPSPIRQAGEVVLPGSGPRHPAPGLRTALGQAWMAVVAAEIFGVMGLGQRMMQASSLLATDIVVVYMITMAGLYGIIDTFSWSPGAHSRVEGLIVSDA